jgi:hypothetical protein
MPGTPVPPPPERRQGHQRAEDGRRRVRHRGFRGTAREASRRSWCRGARSASTVLTIGFSRSTRVHDGAGDLGPSAGPLWRRGLARPDQPGERCRSRGTPASQSDESRRATRQLRIPLAAQPGGSQRRPATNTSARLIIRIGLPRSRR